MWLHSKHVVHRDIKPQNIVITESGKIKVADFGIARAANNATTVNAAGAQAVGSAHYLSPEQARGGYTDHRSDIYSLGVVMYEMFTGKLPFDAEESVSVVMQHLHNEPVPPMDINSEIPAGIEAIILRAMKKEQRLRYDSTTQILEDLVMVYQVPTVDVTELNALKGEDANQLPERMSNPKKPSYRKSKKKKDVKKALLIASTAFFGIALVLIAIVMKILFFPSGSEVEIPDLTGMTYEEALLECERQSKGDIQFDLFVERSEHSPKDKDTIISQTPEGGLMIKKSRELKVVLSLGPVVLELDDYTGKHYKKVQSLLEEKGIKVIIEEEDSNTYDEGTILKQIPAEGTKMADGDEITLYVSRGTENTVVPDVLGRSLSEAIRLITENDLAVGEIQDEDSDKYPKGEICRQGQKPFATVPIDTKIDLFVSTGKSKDSNNKDQQTQQESNLPKKTINVVLSNLPKDRETVSIKLVLEGKPFFQKDYSTKNDSVTIPVETNKTLSLDVYYDGVYITTKEVKY